jgi:mono/diheme cytochrome c family protein
MSEGKSGLAILTLVMVAGGATVVLAAGPPRPPLETQRIGAGLRSFRVHCASCHGTGGEGDGPMATDLKIAPADLAHLSRRHGGTFPNDQVYRAIDGREKVRGHGPGSMPVWGLSFQSRGEDGDQEKETREKVRDLVAYIQSIQK